MKHVYTVVFNLNFQFITKLIFENFNLNHFCKKMDPNEDEDESNPPSLVIPSGDCPPGLESLLFTNKLKVVEECAAGMSFKTFKRYHILDGLGRRLYFCTETKELRRTECCCTSRDYSTTRPWTIDTFDGEETSVMTGSRNRMKTSCCFIKQNIKVSSSGQLLGRINKVFKLYKDESTITIVDAKGTPVIIIKAKMHVGGFWSSKRCHEFPILTPDKKECGMITWFSDSVWEPSNFGIEFQPELDVKIKALLIYATIMIEFSYVQAVRQHRRK